jgi:hypothetical protein
MVANWLEEEFFALHLAGEVLRVYFMLAINIVPNHVTPTKLCDLFGIESSPF